MCGVLYITDFNGNPVNNLLYKRFMNQRTRGLDGFGIYDNESHELYHHTKEDGILKYLKQHKSSDLLFHHRFPTSTRNVKNACHPFSTGDYFGDTEYILIHNGYLYDEVDTANAHLDMGIQYQSLQDDGSFNDSETLLWEVARYIEGHTLTPDVTGAVAFICIARNPLGDKLYFYRNSGSPLKAVFSEHGIQLASEGKGEIVPTDTLFTFDYTTRQLTFRHLEINTYAYGYNYGNYSRSGSSNYDSGQYRSGGHWNNGTWVKDEDIDGDTDDTPVVDDTAPTTAPEYNTELSYPATLTAIKNNWVTDYPERLQKGVKKLYNHALETADGHYEDAYQVIERKINVANNSLKYAKKHKTKQKYTSQLEIANATLEVMMNSRWWDGVDAVDPYFEQPHNDKQLMLTE